MSRRRAEQDDEEIQGLLDSKTDYSSDGGSVILTPRHSYKVYWTRWWVLFLYSWLSCQQCLIWITYSSVAETAKAFYSVTDREVNMWLSSSTVCFLLCCPVSLWLAQTYGFRMATVIATFVSVGSCVLRLLPTLVYPHNNWAHPTIVLCQCINGASGPVFMSLTTKLSEIWFPEEERTISIAIAALANSLGAAVGFIVGPLGVDAFGFRDFMVLETLMSLPGLLLVVFAFPAAPPLPPTLSACVHRVNQDAKKSDDTHAIDAGWWSILSNPQVLSLGLVTGGLAGVFTGWTGMFVELLYPTFSQDVGGWMGFSATLAYILGNLVLGWAGDNCLQRKFKGAILILLLAALGTMMWWSALLPSSFWIHGGILPESKFQVFLAGSLTGFFFGGVNPLSYELASQMSFPASPTYSTTFIISANAFSCVISLTIGDQLYFNVGFATLIASGIFVLLFVKADYLRMDDEEDIKETESLYSNHNTPRSTNGRITPRGVNAVDVVHHSKGIRCTSPIN